MPVMLQYLKKKIAAYIDLKVKEDIHRIEGDLTQKVLTQCRHKFQAPPSLSEPASQNHKFVFICGFARSATTILMDILNSSTEVFIGSEINVHILEVDPDAFAGYGGISIEEQFNNRKKSELPLIYKCGFLPGHTTSSSYSLATFFTQNVPQYRIVGDKIALGDASTHDKSHQQLMEYFCSQNPDATFFFTLRHPLEVLSSYYQMFPDSSLESVMRAMTDTWILILTQFLILNRSYLIFADDVTGELVSELEVLLETKFQFARNSLGKSFKTVHNLEEKMKQFPESQQQIFSKLEETYQQIKELFDIEKTLVKKNRSDLVAKKTANIIQNIERTQDLIAPPQNTD